MPTKTVAAAEGDREADRVISNNVKTLGVSSCFLHLSDRFLYRMVLITQSLKIKPVLYETQGMDLLEDTPPFFFVSDDIYTPEIAELQGLQMEMNTILNS